MIWLILNKIGGMLFICKGLPPIVFLKGTFIPHEK
nr:MAG TPA: hypothetical protein [Caudoviricetes sp.]